MGSKRDRRRKNKALRPRRKDFILVAGEWVTRARARRLTALQASGVPPVVARELVRDRSTMTFGFRGGSMTFTFGDTIETIRDMPVRRTAAVEAHWDSEQRLNCSPRPNGDSGEPSSQRPSGSGED